MTDTTSRNALKHGAFSEILFLPGEDPEEFEKLKSGLFAEYKPSGCSEERLITSIAKALWQERRLALYQYVQHVRARQSGARGTWPDPLEKSFIAYGLASRKAGVPLSDIGLDPVVPKNPAEKSDDEALLELGNLVTLDQLDKELEVENKLQSKIDRLFKRFFQMKGMKPLMGLGESLAPSSIGATPVLELTAVDPIKPAVQ